MNQDNWIRSNGLVTNGYARRLCQFMRFSRLELICLAHAGEFQIQSSEGATHRLDADGCCSRVTSLRDSVCLALYPWHCCGVGRAGMVSEPRWMTFLCTHLTSTLPACQQVQTNDVMTAQILWVDTVLPTSTIPVGELLKPYCETDLPF